MDRGRIKVALAMTFMMSIYILTNTKTTAKKESAKEISVSEKRAKFEDIVYQCGWGISVNDTENLCYTTIKSGNINYTFTVSLFNGEWESDTHFFLRSSGLYLAYNTSTDIEYRGNIEYLEDYKITPYKGNVSVHFSENFHNISGEIVSDDGIINIKFIGKEMSKEEYMLPRIYYAFILSFCYLISIGALAKHTQQCYDSPMFAEKTSLGTIAMIEIFELGFGLWQLHKAFQESSAFNYIFIGAFWSFSSFMLVQTKLLPIVFRAQNTTLSGLGFHISSRIVSSYQTRFCLVCMMFLIVLKLLKDFFVATVPILHLIFIPQIIINSIKGYKDSFSLGFSSSILVTKVIIGLYLFGCPKNFMKYQVNYQLCVNIVLAVSLQILILYYQSFKPRFLVPKRYRPLTYDYFRSKVEEQVLALDADNTCIICMTPLNTGQNTLEPVVNTSKTMHTPCNHRFHRDCLVQWMAVKLECPTCRSKLPIFEENA
jgi:Ring finger domain